jgi:hypothetical protein
MHNGSAALQQQMQQLIGSATRIRTSDHPSADWLPVSDAPFGSDLQLSVIEDGEVHAVVFPCRRTLDGWFHGVTGDRVLVNPTHWRCWDDVTPPCVSD